MNTRPIQLNEVIYNAAEQCFEALVTVHEGKISRRYACSINAPISMPFHAAAAGLSRQALRRHTGKSGLFSEQQRVAAALRAGRARFDPVRWLESIAKFPGRYAT